MSQFKKVFSNRHVILPVIHVESFDQTLRDAEIARETGCDGVFLINHGLSYRKLLEIHHSLFNRLPDWWIGVNCLDLAPQDVFSKISEKVAGVWVDNAMIDERREHQPEAEKIHSARRESCWQGIYFGGVAFKYQRRVEELAQAASIARMYMDVVTTSGPGTGQAAPREKILAMKKALGNSPLAIASGITLNNVYDYLDVADCFLVATGISRSFTEFDAALVKTLVKAVRSYSGNTLSIDDGSLVPNGKGIDSVCFVCEWNEGRSAHLELSVKHKLRAKRSHIRVSSAGFTQGAGINSLRRQFLSKLGIPLEEIEGHKSTVFGTEHARANLILVAELPMKARLLAAWPELQGRIMTVRGFVQGFLPQNESLSDVEAHIEDAGGQGIEGKFTLYRELEVLAEQIALRLLGE